MNEVAHARLDQEVVQHRCTQTRREPQDVGSATQLTIEDTKRLTPAMIFDLQRTVGNRALAGLLSRRSRPAQATPVQQCCQHVGTREGVGAEEGGAGLRDKSVLFKPATGAIQSGDRMIQRQAFVVQRQGKGHTGRLKLITDPIYVTEYNSVYNNAAKAWTEIASKQVLAIGSIYTEAKKPAKPSLLREILIALAMGALGGVVSLVGTAIALKIEKLAAAELGKRLVSVPGKKGVPPGWAYQVGPKQWKLTYDEVKVKEIQEGVKFWAKVISDGPKGSFGDTAKTLAGAKIKKLLDEKKAPIDAFFEGLMEAAVDTGRENSRKVEAKRTETLAQAADPISAAATALETLDNLYDSVTERQKVDTLQAWLQYQAQSRLGATETISVTLGGITKVSTTKLGAYKPTWGDTPGMLYVHCNLIAGSGDTYVVSAELGGLSGTLPGLSKAMLAKIDTKAIADLKLPIIYTVHYYPAVVGEQGYFTVAVNELGSTDEAWVHDWEGIEQRTKEPLKKLGGPDKVHKQLGRYSLKNLNVKADKD